MDLEPKLSDYGLNKEKIELYKHINYIKSKNKIISFCFFIGLLITAIFWICSFHKIPEIFFFKQSGTVKIFLISLWCAICLIFAISWTPFLSIIIAPIYNLYDMIYFYICTKSKDRKISRQLELTHKQYQFDHNEYKRKIEQEISLKEKEEREKIKNKKLFERDYWFSMNAYEFEKEVGILYQKLGYEVKLTAKSNDKGIDLILKKNNNKIIVQCKNHKRPIGPNFARELYGVMHSENATNAILVCSGGFTHGVYDFARGKSFDLINIDKLIEMHDESNLHRYK